MKPPVSLNTCTTTYKPHKSERHIEVQATTPADRRRRRLRQGIDRWHASVCASPRKPKRVLLVALTFADDDPMAARGAIHGFWRHYRARAPRGRYFSWAELQVRGAVHYHALIVDPPWKLERQARRWIGDHWPHARIQPSVQFRPASWFRAAGGNYVKAYAKKPYRSPTPVNGVVKSAGLSIDKSYQAAYELLPREIRTFECSLLEHLVAEIDAHLPRPDVVNLAPLGAPWPVRMLHFWVVGTFDHMPARTGCRMRLRQKKRRPRPSPQSRSRLEETGVHSTDSQVPTA